MTRRSLRVWMFAVALLGALAVSARAGAKPPDLPVDPNDTIPLLTPPTDLGAPEEHCVPPQPMPEPMPGWPTVTIDDNCPNEKDGTCVDYFEYKILTPSFIPKRTLTIYPSTSGIVVSIDPSYTPPPQTVTIYHPVRPKMALSIQQTLDKCLLFGVHPLLSLMPLPESMREESHTQEMVPVTPMPLPEPDDALIFGVGFNSDAGIPHGPGVVVPSGPAVPPLIMNTFAPQGQFNTAATGAANGLLDGITPAGSLTPDLSIPILPPAVACATPDDAPPACHVCPYPCPCDRQIPAIADSEISGSITENLEKLLEADKLYESARLLAKCGEYTNAMACLRQACALWPASRYQAMAADLVSSIVSQLFSHSAAATDTEDEEMPCLPNWHNGDSPCCPKPCMPPNLFGAEGRRNDVYLLRNTSAADVANSLTTFYTNAINIMKAGGVNDIAEREILILPEPLTNTLLISATPKYYPEVIRLIEELDAPVPQILIKVLVAEVDQSNDDDFGVVIGSQIPVPSGEVLNQNLRKLKAQGRLSVLSQPQIQTLDNQSARVFIGQDFPIITGSTIISSGFAQASVAYEPVGIDLNITPRIGPDGKIMLHVATDYSLPRATNLPVGGGITAVSINRWQMDTTVVTMDGKTVAISRPITEGIKVEKKVPYLCDLPVIGSMFRYRMQTESKRQLLVVLTPHIIRSQAPMDETPIQGCEESENCMPGCGMPCQMPGLEVQVTGLMKACHLALSCGCHHKAAELARQAYALDAERVAADPVVYKMHLLALKLDQGACCCNDCSCDPCSCEKCAKAKKCCCEDEDCCCPGKCRSASRAISLPFNIFFNKPVQVPYVRVEMVPPSLPPVDATIVIQLEKLIDQGQAEVARTKPGLEVVEEASEGCEMPRAIAKPFRMQSAATGTVLTCDDLLKFLPGETWTEFDPKTNHVRALWRVRVGGTVYCVRYDGSMSVDMVVTPTGSGENCEDHK